MHLVSQYIILRVNHKKIHAVHFVTFLDQAFAICADQKGFIRCEKGTKIKIISAVYGRTDDKLCPYGDTNTRTCRSLTSDITVKWGCNGYKTCHLHASDQIFGDPCQNVSKYLEVKYRCIIKEDQDTRVKGSLFMYKTSKVMS